MRQVEERTIFMKKIIAFMLIATVSLLCACESPLIGKTPFPDIDKAISATVKITDGSFEAAANVSRTYRDEWTMTLTEPYSLCGIEVTFEDGESETAYEDFSSTGGEPETLAVAFFRGMENIISAQDITYTESANILTACVTSDGETITLSYDKTGNKLLNLRCGNATFTFSDVTLTDIIPREAKLEE